jgi:quercetin dioxygenase-like cupin family protein
MMKKTDLQETNIFDEKAMKKFLIHDSAWFRIINFNIPAGRTFPVHSHELEGQLSIQVLAGEGFFLGAEGAKIPARPGEILVCDIIEPHGVEATTDIRILVTIAPPL